MKLVLGSLLVLALPFAVARADHPRGPRRPPQAAFDACAKAKAGDACSMTLHDHTIAGVCAAAPDASALACRPDHPPGPPPEALEACSGKAAGDACSIEPRGPSAALTDGGTPRPSTTHDGHAIAGTCAAGPDGNGALACLPDGPPPGH